MFHVMRRLTPIFLVFFFVACLGTLLIHNEAEARSRMGGRIFKRPPVTQKSSPAQSNSQATKNTKQSSFGRGLAGGLLGGALGGLLFGSMFGMNGSGMGILPVLLLFGAGYFFYRRFLGRSSRVASSNANYGSPLSSMPGSASPEPDFDIPPVSSRGGLEEGLAMIQRTDPGFDPDYFVEVASDVFFKVQAGWMRRDLDSYRHLLGNTLAGEYDDHFAEMRRQGHINKLESIAVRNVKVVDCGSDGREDFVTVLFTASLLDYTVDDQSNQLVKGSMTDPVKFAERWTWARPVGTEDWKLEGIEPAEH